VQTHQVHADQAEEPQTQALSGAGEAMTIEERFLRLMARHLRDSDASLSDADFIRKVMERFERERREPIIDVNE
jgi:hypothetical protein